MRRILAAAAVSLVLSGCTAITIGEPYDKAIDDGLNGFQKASAEFIKSMEINAGTAAGSYNSNEARKYYAASAATLSNLELRAELLSSRTCPTEKVLELLGSIGLDATDTTIGQAEAQLGGEASDSQPLDVSGNCITIMVRGVQMAEDDLEGDHREANRLTPRVALLNSEAINASVRVTLTALRSKNY